MGICNDWEAFCFDEACMYMYEELCKEDAPTPCFLDEYQEDNQKSNKDTIDWMLKHSKVIN